MRWALAWRPEWPFFILIAAAWLLMAAGAVADRSRGQGVTSLFVCTIPIGPGRDGIALSGVTAWTVMSVAMMLPVTLPWVRFVGLNSTARRRLFAMALYVAAFMAVWSGVGAVELGVATATAALVPPHVALSIGLFVAGAWEFTTIKRTTLVRCHWTAGLPPTGRRADLACLRFGWRRGVSSAVGCWALMFVMAFLGPTQITLMAMVTILAVTQERTAIGWRFLPASGGGLIVASLAVLMLGVVG
jgi:predicted metal-binding membrane protein